MKSTFLVLTGMALGLALAAVVAFAAFAAPAAFAQGPVGGQGGYGGMMGAGGRGGIGGPANSLVAVAARTLGIEQADLNKALSGGQTIAAVAKSKSVDTSKIVDAIVAPRAEFLKTAVKDGRLTQAQADANLAAMKANIAAQLTAQHTPGHGAAFVDSDQDGICDNMENGTQPGTHQGIGGMMGGRWNR